MEYVAICIAALVASALTFFSGFGLGTILVPVFALFFPIEVAIGLGAVVHFLNGLFKLVLVGRNADWNIVLRFGLVAGASAVLGAWVLSLLTHLPVIASYSLRASEFHITPIKLVIGLLLLGFTVLELTPRFRKLSFPPRYLPLGGFVSGFFGGLSGNQGAFRSAFLIKSGLSKEAFIASGVVIAVMIDIARLAFYSQSILTFDEGTDYLLLILATLSAFLGAFLGNRILKKIEMKTVTLLVSVMLIAISLALIAGIV